MDESLTLADDAVHLNEKGHKLIAKLHREAGYEFAPNNITMDVYYRLTTRALDRVEAGRNLAYSSEGYFAGNGVTKSHPPAGNANR